MTSAHSPQAKPWKTAAYLIKLQVADYSRQLLFCRRLRVPTPRHDSSATIDPVETVTPPKPPLRRRPVAEDPGLGANRNNRLMLLLLFYANSGFAARLLLLQIDALVLVADDGGANLRRSLA